MSDKSESIKYFPLAELVLFLVTVALTFVIVNNLNLSIWLLILCTVAAYFIFLGGTSIINVTDEKIEIMFLNLIGGRVSIELKKIVKVWAGETYEIETGISVETGYYLFSREYNLEFLDDSGKRRQLNFKINNRKKEIQIIERINSHLKVAELGL
jgi:hypothetical protein